MYLVTFLSKRHQKDDRIYRTVAQDMIQLAKKQPGFIRIESWRNSEGFGVTLSWWKDEASIKAWRQNTEHLIAQKRGKKDWYAQYEVFITKVERHYSHP